MDIANAVQCLRDFRRTRLCQTPISFTMPTQEEKCILKRHLAFPRKYFRATMLNILQHLTVIPRIGSNKETLVVYTVNYECCNLIYIFLLHFLANATSG
jgi:hypothetical protein